MEPLARGLVKLVVESDGWSPAGAPLLVMRSDQLWGIETARVAGGWRRRTPSATPARLGASATLASNLGAPSGRESGATSLTQIKAWSCSMPFGSGLLAFESRPLRPLYE
jgi:hypothetical protein